MSQVRRTDSARPARIVHSGSDFRGFPLRRPASRYCGATKKRLHWFCSGVICVRLSAFDTAVPIVSSTSSIGGFSPRQRCLGLFSWRLARELATRLSADSPVEQLRRLRLGSRRPVRGTEPAQVVLQAGRGHAVESAHPWLEPPVGGVDVVDVPGADGVEPGTKSPPRGVPAQVLDHLADGTCCTTRCPQVPAMPDDGPFQAVWRPPGSWLEPASPPDAQSAVFFAVGILHGS
jgi:hypothetical protein